MTLETECTTNMQQIQQQLPADNVIGDGMINGNGDDSNNAIADFNGVFDGAQNEVTNMAAAGTSNGNANGIRFNDFNATTCYTCGNTITTSPLSKPKRRRKTCKVANCPDPITCNGGYNKNTCISIPLHMRQKRKKPKPSKTNIN